MSKNAYGVATAPLSPTMYIFYAKETHFRRKCSMNGRNSWEEQFMSSSQKSEPGYTVYPISYFSLAQWACSKSPKCIKRAYGVPMVRCIDHIGIRFDSKR